MLTLRTEENLPADSCWRVQGVEFERPKSSWPSTVTGHACWALSVAPLGAALRYGFGAMNMLSNVTVFGTVAF